MDPHPAITKVLDIAVLVVEAWDRDGFVSSIIVDDLEAALVEGGHLYAPPKQDYPSYAADPDHAHWFGADEDNRPPREPQYVSANPTPREISRWIAQVLDPWRDKIEAHLTSTEQRLTAIEKHLVERAKEERRAYRRAMSRQVRSDAVNRPESSQEEDS